MATASSSFGYFPEYSDSSKSGLNPSQIGTTSNITAVTAKQAKNYSYTAENMVKGLLLLDPNGGTNCNLDTAAEIIKLIGNIPSTSFLFTIKNTAEDSGTITVTTTDDKTTLTGEMKIEQNNTRQFIAIITEVGKMTIISTGTFDHAT